MNYRDRKKMAEEERECEQNKLATSSTINRRLTKFAVSKLKKFGSIMKSRLSGMMINKLNEEHEKEALG